MTEQINVEINEAWQDLKNHPDYEICVQFPHQIRKRSTGRIIAECDRGNGYLCCALNGKLYLKHRLVALQFIENPDNLQEVDHINGIRSDNRIDNLRWCTRTQNLKNISGRDHKYVFYDELPETAEPLTAYAGHDLDGVFVDYENEKCYLFNGVRYRELVPCRDRGNIRYNVCDNENKCVSLCHSVLFP